MEIKNLPEVAIADAFEAMIDVVAADGDLDRVFETFITVVKMQSERVSMGHADKRALPIEFRYKAMIESLEALRKQTKGL